MRKHIVKIFLQGLGYIISEFGSYNSQITWIRLSLEKSGGQKWRFFTKFHILARSTIPHFDLSHLTL